MNKISVMRKKTHLSQADFAQLLHIPLSTIQAWEQQKRKPPDYVITLIEYRLKRGGLI